MNRRVVITGMGIVSPIGCDVDTYQNNLLAGLCGIGEITRKKNYSKIVPQVSETIQQDHHREEQA